MELVWRIEKMKMKQDYIDKEESKINQIDILIFIQECLIEKFSERLRNEAYYEGIEKFWDVIGDSKIKVESAKEDNERRRRELFKLC
jgi:hypothetical protein